MNRFIKSIEHAFGMYTTFRTLKIHKVIGHLVQCIVQFGRLRLGSTQMLEKGHQQGAKRLYTFSKKTNFIHQFCKKVYPLI